MARQAIASENNAFDLGNEVIQTSRHLGGESVELITTPFKTDKAQIFITMGVTGAVALVYSFDSQIHDKLTSRRDRNLNKAADTFALVGDPYLHLGLAAAMYGGGVISDSYFWKETGEMAGEALILADAATFIIKESSGRGRPSTTSSKSDFKPFRFQNGYDSLPSMHTSSSFALASVLSSTTENFVLKSAYYGTAALVGMSRMYQNKHWASDVLLGAVTGELCGRVVTGFHAGNKRVALAPQTYERGAGLALVGIW